MKTDYNTNAEVNDDKYAEGNDNANAKENAEDDYFQKYQLHQVQYSKHSYHLIHCPDQNTSFLLIIVFGFNQPPLWYFFALEFF